MKEEMSLIAISRKTSLKLYYRSRTGNELNLLEVVKNSGLSNGVKR
jgi:hypothetical protein|tara:strand:- start:151 stop:288 length:138 start_codon:yes stop_codon:yes gene_type:complete